MVSLKKYNLQGEALGEVDVSNELAQAKAHSQMIKDYIIALRANARSWNASTKTRAEVKHTTKKPSPQKGQGRARHGNLVAPQYRGGGRAFGPKPKSNVRIDINRGERKKAIRALLGEMVRDGKVVVVDSLDMEAPKTKVVRNFIDTCDLGKRVLFMGESSFVEIGGETKRRLSVSSLQHENIKKSLHNIPKVLFRLVGDVDGYSIALANGIVVTESAFVELEQWLVGE